MAKLFSIRGDEVKTVRMKAEKFIFEQSKKAVLVGIDFKFDQHIVDLSDISDEFINILG